MINRRSLTAAAVIGVSALSLAATPSMAATQTQKAPAAQSKTAKAKPTHRHVSAAKPNQHM